MRGAFDESAAEDAVARGQRMDQWIPLLDSPASRLGAEIATAIGFVWGALWSTGQIRRIDGLWVFAGMPSWTFPRGGVCVGSCYLTADNTAARVLRHERVHVRQWRRYGLLLPILNVMAGRDARRNRFEIEAGLEDGGYLPRTGGISTR
ncbi:hypothetical protein GCM10009808_03360 [Microbacterium sediminicola]|uniref:Fe-S oxidoreductase n=1 Tax=Microbacterium sediminicola TaxID=415210 RepID=A0ABN2HKZ4_9MICO